MSSPHLSASRRRHLNWAILKFVKESGRAGINEGLLLQVVSDVKIAATLHEVREAASYLEQKDYITISEEQGIHAYRITSEGTDLVEYEPDVKLPRSIGRPVKYWED